ncbi:hypothetical protein BDR03DRAFT_1014985 [Suillus americanus]|nr:hypothetical protein BDR03DRAFT_1014985 [Suillus americanus]
MAPFNLALLTMTPSPSPEERPSLLVKATTLPKEVEESFEARALCVWAVLRERLDTLIKVMPNDDPALFVNRELSYTNNLGMDPEHLVHRSNPDPSSISIVRSTDPL